MSLLEGFHAIINFHGGLHNSRSGESNDGAGISNLVGLQFTMTGASTLDKRDRAPGWGVPKIRVDALRKGGVCNRGFWESPRRCSAAEATTALSCLFKRCCPISNRPNELPGSGFWRRLTPWGIILSFKNTRRLFCLWGKAEKCRTEQRSQERS